MFTGKMHASSQKEKRVAHAHDKGSLTSRISCQHPNRADTPDPWRKRHIQRGIIAERGPFGEAEGRKRNQTAEEATRGTNCSLRVLLTAPRKSSSSAFS
jgi:hypothetical protein